VSGSIVHTLTVIPSGLQTNGIPVCGRKIVATAHESLPCHTLHCAKFLFLTAGGKSMTVRVEDKCVACAEFDLDMSPVAFNTLANPLVGRLHGVTWNLY
jgi:Lytic transglycolase